MLKFCGLFVSLFISGFYSVLASGINHAPEFEIGVNFNVEKIEDDFYIGRMESQAGKKLWLVMERISASNHACWGRYMEAQNNLRAVEFAYASSGSTLLGSVMDGSSHFRLVLNEVSFTNNEVWAAYITKADFPVKIAKGLEADYSAENFFCKDDPFAKDIEMFVTVTSSAEALITSHMGIASTLEGLTTREKGTSLDLHSFAAKVMLIRNPDRRFMINAPVFAMEKIIVMALPEHTFVGTYQMRERMQKSLGVGFKEYCIIFGEECEKELKRKAEEEAAARNVRLQYEIEQFNIGRRPGKTIENLREYLSNTLPTYSLIELNSEGSFTASQLKINARYDDEIKLNFNSFKNPCPFPDASSPDCATIDFLKFMEKHPPILSIQDTNYLAIYEPENPSVPWLTIDEANSHIYDWIRTVPFRPAGNTHFIAVDLLVLAQSKRLIAIEKDAGFYKALGSPFSITIHSKDFASIDQSFIDELKNNLAVVDLTIETPPYSSSLIEHKNFERLIREGLQNKPNLRSLTVVGNFDVGLFFETNQCIGNSGTLPEEFLIRPHLQFFEHLHELQIKGEILGIARNDSYFLIDFIGHLRKSKQLKKFTR